MKKNMFFLLSLSVMLFFNASALETSVPELSLKERFAAIFAADSILDASVAIEMKNFQLYNPSIIDDPELFAIFQNELLSVFKENKNVLNDAIFNIWMGEGFTESDLLKVLEFYESELGKKLLSRIGSVMEKGYEVGLQWGKSLAANIQEKINAAVDAKFGNLTIKMIFNKPA